MVNTAALSFIAFVSSLELKLPFFLQQVQHARGEDVRFDKLEINKGKGKSKKKRKGKTNKR